jgi:hypothetical protein
MLQVIEVGEWLVKHDALAAPAVLSHLEAAVNDTEEEEGGAPSSGGVIWHKVLRELLLTYADLCSSMLWRMLHLC